MLLRVSTEAGKNGHYGKVMGHERNGKIVNGMLHNSAPEFYQSCVFFCRQ